MRRNPESSFRSSGPYTSPGTPQHRNMGGGGGDVTPKTWSSERVPLPTTGGGGGSGSGSGSTSRRHINAAAFIPFNSGRTLPSKWDDAERWITSPISSHAAFKNSIAQTPTQAHHRQPKSKSGPLGPTELVCLPNYSPSGPFHEGGDNAGNFMANSPLTTGVLIPGGCSVSVGYGAGINARADSFYAENNNCNMMRSTSVPGLSDSISESSQDDKLDDGTNEEEAAQASRRDIATQMSPPQGSTPSSSHGRLSFFNLSSSLHENPSAKEDVRDVQVDKGTTTTSAPIQSRRLGLRKMSSTNTTEDLPSSLKVGKNTSKFEREEAKITAWENLQKAKAEAATKKLEMKLEKQRSASMDKITNKLRGAQMKSQAMREFLPSDQAPVNSHKGFSFCIYVKICNCFVCTKT